MFKNVFVFDLTRHRGPMHGLISSARAYAQTSQATGVEWFVSPFQHVDGASLVETIHRVSEFDVWPTLEKKLHEFTRDGVAGDTVYIFSHSGYVLSKAEALRSSSLLIRASSFKFLPRSTALHSFQSNAAGKMSVDEAIELTKKILAEEGHVSEDSALLECYLRPRLARYDRRAVKRPGDPSSLNLIREIVDHGQNNGWLKRTRMGGQPGTERIWLAQQPSQAAGVVTSVATVSAPLVLPEAPAIVVSQEPSPVPCSQAPAASKGKARTQEMIAILNKAFVYSPSNIRRYAFSAIGSIKKEGMAKKQTVAQFMKEVKDRVLAQTQKDGVSSEHWRATMDAIQEMLLSAEALIGPGEKPITRGLHARGTQLVSILDNFEDVSELFLLKLLIRKMQLTSKDRVAIAHALFKEGSGKDYDKLEERLDALFTMLGNELAESAEGIIILETELGKTATSPPRVN